MSHDRKYRAILLFGVPGSGKGTQGKVLGTLVGFVHVATGDIFRQLNKLGQLGREVARYANEGLLVPDELTIRIWRNHMSLLGRESGGLPRDRSIVILDGIPRTHAQARLMADDIDPLGIFYLKLRSDDEAVQRIKARALKENRTDDADEGVIRHRLETFYRETANTLSFYDPALVIDIDASQRPIEVLRDLAGHVARILPEC